MDNYFMCARLQVCIKQQVAAALHQEKARKEQLASSVAVSTTAHSVGHIHRASYRSRTLAPPRAYPSTDRSERAAPAIHLHHTRGSGLPFPQRLHWFSPDLWPWWLAGAAGSRSSVRRKPIPGAAGLVSQRRSIARPCRPPLPQFPNNQAPFQPCAAAPRAVCSTDGHGRCVVAAEEEKGSA
jgi:hypothetical protein